MRDEKKERKKIQKKNSLFCALAHHSAETQMKKIKKTGGETKKTKKREKYSPFEPEKTPQFCQPKKKK
jgi:hypothetical protein